MGKAKWREEKGEGRGSEGKGRTPQCLKCVDANAGGDGNRGGKDGKEGRGWRGGGQKGGQEVRGKGTGDFAPTVIFKSRRLCPEQHCNASQ